MKLAGAYEKLRKQRDDFLHKLSRWYIGSNDLVAIEKVDVSGMARNHTLSRKILDASWRKFFHMLSYKAKRAGRRVVGVDPGGTSGGLSGDDPLGDYISAKRTLNRAHSGPGQPAEPVERRPLSCIFAGAVVTGQVFSLKQEAPCES